MKRILFTLSTFVVYALMVVAQEIPTPVLTTNETSEDPHSTGWWIILLDKDSNEIWYKISSGMSNEYSTTVTLECSTYGDFYMDPALSEQENDLNRPPVPFRFAVNGTVWGADEPLKATIIPETYEDLFLELNKLYEGAEGYYTVPVGLSYTLGIYVNPETGEYSVFCIQAVRISPYDSYHDNGFWISLLDKNGNKIWHELHKDNNGSYVTTLSFGDNTYSDWSWDPNLSDEENELSRPAVPFRFVINGYTWGANAELKATVLNNETDYNEENKLYFGMYRGYYTIPFDDRNGYVIGIYTDKATGDYFVNCKQGISPDAVDELSDRKAIAGVRYYNMTGQEMPEACGVTIVVTTYSDGTTSAVKVIK